MTDTIDTTELVAVAEQNELPAERAQPLLVQFQPMFAEAETLIEQANDVDVTDATQVTEMKQARKLRLELRQVRVNVEKTRKALKEESLRTGKAIDGMANVLKYLIEPVEKRLDDAEKFAERAEAERKRKLQQQREELLRPFGVDTAYYDLANMPEDTWRELLESSRMAHEARVEAERKAEQERQEAERRRIEEEKRIREENERLKREREEAEKKAEEERKRQEAERKAAEAKAREEREKIEAEARAERERLEKAAAKERAERERLEKEEKERQAAEEKKRKAESAAKRRAERAPDRKKLAALAKQINDFPLPECTTDAGSEAVNEIRDGLIALAEKINRIVKNMD